MFKIHFTKKAVKAWLLFAAFVIVLDYILISIGIVFYKFLVEHCTLFNCVSSLVCLGIFIYINTLFVLMAKEIKKYTEQA